MISTALLNPDGTAAIHPEFPATSSVNQGVIASDGPHRETRRVHESRPRVYELAFSLANEDEIDRLALALAETKNGASTLRWRAPEDAPGSVATAPRWRILNASDASAFVLRRSTGGVSGNFNLQLEELCEN